MRLSARAAVIGPTATLAEPYRSRGVTVVGGTRVQRSRRAAGDARPRRLGPPPLRQVGRAGDAAAALSSGSKARAGENGRGESRARSTRRASASAAPSPSHEVHSAESVPGIIARIRWRKTQP
ncbi:MAG: hypothetical protein U1F49_20075 [Rubrivivax sp.]